MHCELQTLHANIEETGNAKRSWISRSSVRLYLRDDDGHLGLGEAAPLPGMSPESARDARKALSAVAWPDDPPTEPEEIAAIVETIPASIPSARFAAESALASLAASIFEIPLWAMWASEVEELPVAASLMGSDEFAVKRAAREAAAHEVLAVKMKVGSRTAAADDALIREVRAIRGPLELRRDANGTLPPKRLAQELERLAAPAPAFLEEPCALEHVLALSEVPFPIALDESIAGPEGDAQLDRALGCDHVGVIVLKPTLLGGLERCRALAARAREAGKKVVVSHLLEGTIARTAAAHLALALGGEAAGLGDHPALIPLSDGLTATWIDLAWIEPPSGRGLGLELAW